MQELQVDGDKEVALTLKNSSAVYLLQLVGALPMSAVANAGQDGLFRELAQQIRTQNQPQA